MKKIYIPKKKYPSLTHSLAVWFLLLSVTPLIFVSWFSYQQANSSLTTAAKDQLKQSANLSISFINVWFDYRLMDLKTQSESHANTLFLGKLIEQFNQSGKPLEKYIKSYDWAKLIDHNQDDLISFSRDYDYIYDVFLIDKKGNILYSVAREDDLGTNLINGPYANTLFAHSVKNTLETGQINFSDLEHYSPSNNIIAGFLNAPILNEFGDSIGVFSIQIRFDRVRNILKKQSKQSSLRHYLVGTDGKLRSPLSSNEDEVLKRNINTEHFRLWFAEHELLLTDLDDQEEAAFIYAGPDGNQVIGIHNMLRLPGSKWALISEIDLDEALAPTIWLQKITSLLVLLTTIVVIWIAIFLAKRITNPISTLLMATKKTAEGKTNQLVEINVKNEIGELAESFNHMQTMRQKYEEDLKNTHKFAQKSLLELNEQKYALDQHAIVAITDVQGTITFINEKFSEISGYSSEELIGQNHRLLNSGYHPTEFFKEMYRTIANGDVWHGEVCNKTKNGEIYWVDTTIVPFMDKTNTKNKPVSYIAIRADITKRKQTEIELIASKEKAEEATRMKSEFLANMSHEIRTPMNGVIGMTGLLLDTNLEPKQREFAENTMTSAESLLTIINDILDFSKIEAGKLELEVLPFNLESLTEDVSELMAIKCREKNIEMLLRYKPNTPKFVMGDPGRIRQILLNLLSNAIKFTEQGAVLLTIEALDISNDMATLSIAVTDSGIGIDSDKLDKIFNKFDQEDGSTTRKYGGTGLGLAICRQLSHMMQGDIHVESKKGEGSTFSVTMKLAISDENAISTVQHGNLSKLNGLKALIVDDLLIARTIFTEQLSTVNLNIDAVSSAKEAIEKLHYAIKNNKPYDIVLTDFNMPEMNGEMLAKEIQRNNLLTNGILVFATSSPRKGDAAHLKEMGFDGYLTKPTRPSEIARILSIIWESKQQGTNIPLVTRHMLQEAQSSNLQQIKFPGASILLAEDNPINQMVATEYLERYGCTITPAGNGLEALIQFKDNAFDLIFMDCQMPEMDGYEATGEIRNWEKDRSAKATPIIAFTANAMQGDKDKCLEAGMDDYISKPVDEKSLEKVLSKWLKHKSQEVDQAESSKSKPSHAEDHLIEASSDDVCFDQDTFNNLKQLFKDKFPDAVKQQTSNTKENISIVSQAIADNDIKTLEITAHSIKGASAQFGAIRLSSLAAEMELFGKNGDFDKAKELYPQLEEAQKEISELMLKNLS